MTRRSLPCSVLAGSLLFASALYAQSPTPAPVPTLKANTRIVVVDVVVTDQKQNAVRIYAEREGSAADDCAL